MAEPLTPAQRAAHDLLWSHRGRTARQLGVRVDVLRRLEEKGLAKRDAHGRWHPRAATADSTPPPDTP